MSLLEQLVKIQEHLLAENHPDRLASQRELARIYQANGQVKEVMFLLEQAGQDQEADISGGPSFSTNDTAPARNIRLGPRPPKFFGVWRRAPNPVPLACIE